MVSTATLEMRCGGLQMPLSLVISPPQNTKVSRPLESLVRIATNRNETECLPTVYKCIFGISIDKTWKPQVVQTTLNKGHSYLVISGPKHRVYWFLFVNMGKTYYGPEPPRFTKENEEVLANEHLNDKIVENRTFRDLYSTKISSVLTPLPEYVFKKWHFRRIMTIGDAAHKVSYSHSLFLKLPHNSFF